MLHTSTPPNRRVPFNQLLRSIGTRKYTSQVGDGTLSPSSPCGKSGLRWGSPPEGRRSSGNAHAGPVERRTSLGRRTGQLKLGGARTQDYAVRYIVPRP